MIVQIEEFGKKFSEYDAIRELYPNSFVEYNNVKLSNNSPSSSPNNVFYLKKKQRTGFVQNFNSSTINKIKINLDKLKVNIEEAKSQLIKGSKEEAERYSANYVYKFKSQIDKLGENIEKCIEQSIANSNFKNAFTAELKLQKLVQKFINSGYNFKYPNSYTQFNNRQKYSNLQSRINSSMTKIKNKIKSNNNFAKGKNRVEELPGNSRRTNLNYFEEENGNRIPELTEDANEYNNKTTLTRKVTSLGKNERGNNVFSLEKRKANLETKSKNKNGLTMNEQTEYNNILKKLEKAKRINRPNTGQSRRQSNETNIERNNGSNQGLNNESTQGSTPGSSPGSTQGSIEESTTQNSGISNNQSRKGFNNLKQAKEAFSEVLLKHKNEINSNAKKRAEFTNMRSYLTKLQKGLVNKSNDPTTRNGKTGAPQYIELLGQAEEALKEKKKEIEKIKITKTAANAFLGLGR
jgi:hypothetical protein